MMIGSCPTLYPQGEFLRPLLAIIDCQAQTIGTFGYQALAAPGSAVGLLLGAALTIFVGLLGFRLLFGHVPSARDGVLAVVKIGVVLTLATSWPVFRTLVYDTTIHGPAELASAIGRPASVPGADGGLTDRLQGVDGMLAELQLIGTGRPPNSQPMFGPTQPMGAEQQQEELRRMEDATQRPRWNPETDQKTLSQARMVYLAGAIGAYAAVRLLAGLLLAIGPLFALFLLFNPTRGLFNGWVRGLAAAALGSVMTTIILGAQLALTEPWLAGVVGARRAFIPTPDVPLQLLVLNLGFVAVLIAALVLSARLAHGFDVGAAVSRLAARGRDSGRAPGALRDSAALRGAGASGLYERSRAVVIADAIGASSRRELRVLQAVPAARLTAPQGDDESSQGAGVGPYGPAVPQGSRRRVRNRTSGGAQRRDNK